MTLSQVTAMAERSRPGVLTLAEKISLVSTLDGVVFTEIIKRHIDPPVKHFEGYKTDTSGEVELLVPEPYAELYLRRLEAECDYRCGEIERYEASRALFNGIWESFLAYWRREHRPIGVKKWKLGEG